MKKQHDVNNLIILTLIFAVLTVVFFSTLTNSISWNTKMDFTDESFDANDRYSIGSLFKRNPTQDKPDMKCYSLEIVVPYTLKDFAIMLPAIDSEFELTINGETIFRRDSKDCETYGKPVILSYPPKSAVLNINAYIPDIQTSAIKTSTLPMDHPDFCIGSYEALITYQNIVVGMDFILIFICLISFIYQLMTYATQRSNSITITFCLLSLSIVISVIVANQRVINYFGNDLPSNIALNVALISYAIRCICILTCCNYYVSKDPTDFSHRKYIYSLIFIIFVILMIPTSYSYYVRAVLFPLTLISIIYAIVITIYHRRKYNNNALISVTISLFMPFIASTIDTLKAFSINIIFMIPPVCFVVFIIINDIIRIYSRKQVDSNITYLTASLKDAILEMQNNRSTYISSHIKPDYLYETLESIKSGIDVDQEKVDKLIQSLSKYLRATLDFSGNKLSHSLSEELELCEAYINLAKEQNPKISFHYPNIEDVPYATVPKFSIQALVENCVLHSFQGTLKPRVDIQITDSNDYIRISVTDNGSGMTDREITESLSTPKNLSAIGLYHINNTLIDMFNTRIDITSISYKNTTISFRVPRNEEVEDA